MSSESLAVVALWLGGIAALTRDDPLGRPAMGAAIALALAALVGLLS
nr:hypothetical protein [uncultured Lichenicoccus sp.]